MYQIIPWPELTAAVQTVYPTISEKGGRPPIPVERMLRIYFLQLWFNLSDLAVEEALYDSVAMHRLVRIDLGVEGAPDETTVPSQPRYIVTVWRVGYRFALETERRRA